MRWDFSIAREVRAELDSAVVPSVRGQPGASVSVHSGVQPWELPSPVMSAQGGQALVAAERAGQADQDGRPSGATLPPIDLSVVRGVGSSTVVRGVLDRIGPVIAGAKLRESTTTILPRGREHPRESACLQCAFTPLAGTRRRQRRTRSMVHGKNRIPYWIDRRLNGRAGPDHDATISFGLPFESEDCQYGEIPDTLRGASHHLELACKEGTLLFRYLRGRNVAPIPIRHHATTPLNPAIYNLPPRPELWLLAPQGRKLNQSKEHDDGCDAYRITYMGAHRYRCL